MSSGFRAVVDGTVTSPAGFLAGAVHAGIKTRGEAPLDLGILYSESPCVAAGVFTTNKVQAAPVLLSQERIARASARALVVNAGCANACTGEQGLADAREMAALAARKVGVVPGQVLVASTGVIGVPLPMDRIRGGIPRISLARDGGHRLTQAIMTTDTFPKEVALSVRVGGKRVTVGGVAKGAGMIYPNMATLLSFITTDAAIDPGFARFVLRRAVGDSFNMIAVDGDTSTNDMVLLLANGLAGNPPLRYGTTDGRLFEAALREVCSFLAKCIARDGEGATRLIEVEVARAATKEDARLAARAVVNSSLVKAAVHGADPNWGRIVAAVGRSGAEVDQSRIGLYLGDLCLLKAGSPVDFSHEEARRLLSGGEVRFTVQLNLGRRRAVAWGCDLSQEYVVINSAYAT
ncbi:MAG: bifunctional glutamate N-acetyltransferase/amino-acid acetyltransferase ArgJ [Chloroflexi bacterium]|nr:bifunctional glutamate N-acetyltransferase/amino-acid acetyltransferase ArgJ [Chloroflexota bacterium]